MDVLMVIYGIDNIIKKGFEHLGKTRFGDEYADFFTRGGKVFPALYGGNDMYRLLEPIDDEVEKERCWALG